MKNASSLKKLINLFSLICLIFCLVLCHYSPSQINEANKLLDKGNFDTALAQFQILSKKYPENPRVLASLGMLLTLKRISLFSGIDLLIQSLKYKINDEILRQLAIIYIAMGHPEYIEQITDSNIIKTEKLLNWHILHMRYAASCIQAPSARKLRKFSSLRNKAKKQSSSIDFSSSTLSASAYGKFYRFLCEMALHNTSSNKIYLQKLYRKLPNPKLKCEAISLWLYQDRQKKLYYEFLQKEKGICQKKYLSVIAVHRPISLLPTTDKGKSKLQKSQTFLTIDPFSPEDIGPEGLKPPWKIQIMLKKQQEKAEEENKQTQDQLPLLN